MNLNPLTTNGAVNRELKKEEILSMLNTMCFRGRFWHTVGAISRVIGVSGPATQTLVTELLFEGFLQVRDPDTKNQGLLYSLRPTLRQEHISAKRE